MVSRTWRKVRTDWEGWNGRDLQVRTSSGSSWTARSERRSTAGRRHSLLVAGGVRRNGQKVLLALRSMDGESTAAWAAFLADMTRRGLNAPEFVIVDGAPGLEAALWPGAPVQRCTVHSTATCWRTRRIGCKRRRAAEPCLAGLRRLRTARNR
ncbi:transposase [Paracoccus sp. S-4012]|uniref:transposase n=1 Tax=Paracoccus sp. S-4012 TaxID=2665648 RepID=UPI0018A1C2DE